MAASISENGSLTSRAILHLLASLAPRAGPQESVAAALQLVSSAARRSEGTVDTRQLLQQLADAVNMPVDDFSSQAEVCSIPQRSEQPNPALQQRRLLEETCESLLDSKLQLLFELWDRDGDGLISFADIALAFRKFSPAMQRLTNTAADATEALYLFSRGGVALDRLQFASLIEGLAAAANAESQAMLDLLIILAGTDDRPAEELALLLAESAVQRKHDTLQPQPVDNGSSCQQGLDAK